MRFAPAFAPPAPATGAKPDTASAEISSDVSYLPDLEAYLADLRRSRERLLGAFDADPWAVAEAMPSDEEIRRVKQLIDRVKADLADLTEQERAEIQQAVAVVRRSRTTMLGMPRMHPGTSRPAADGSA